MVRRYRRSIYDELDELRASMDYLYQLALEPTEDPLLLPGDPSGIVCRYTHNLNAEVAELDDEISVTVDTVPGMGDAKISVDLVNETTLKITCDRGEERPEDRYDNCLHEERSFSLNHMVPLPGPVTIEGAALSMRNGVLDIRVKKLFPCW